MDKRGMEQKGQELYEYLHIDKGKAVPCSSLRLRFLLRYDFITSPCYIPSRDKEVYI
ncbi:hypothetical protein Leryth_021387 [Lithospermum erythrorhizon]|nr:hypothetical protein Leryth_021387 [Lithospermum erythrorhizon]